MSICYYIVCNTCKEKINAAFRSTGFDYPAPAYYAKGDIDKLIVRFIYAHRKHNVEFLSDGDIQIKPNEEEYYEYTEWIHKNEEELVKLISNALRRET